MTISTLYFLKLVEIKIKNFQNSGHARNVRCHPAENRYNISQLASKSCNRVSEL